MGQTKELAEIKEFVGIVKNLDISQQNRQAYVYS